jgi:dTDP-4-amino-4,6-dideoxygalactose transaminase
MSALHLPTWQARTRTGGAASDEDLVRFQRPILPPVDEIERYFAASRAVGWYSNGGPCHALLSERASELLGGRPVVPVSSGGIGLILALRALVGAPRPQRTEVLLPSFTYAACAAAIVWCGLEPVFCDIEDEGWHMCSAGLADALAEREGRVAAILACSTFGTPVPTVQAAEWARLAEDAGVPLVLDSAAGLGAVGDGPLPDAEIFSMHATKPMPIGEGGLVALRDPDVAERVRLLANYGLDEDHVAVTVGLNGKLDEWHAATALAGLDQLDGVLLARRSRAAFMRRELAGDPIRFQALAERSGAQFVPALLRSRGARERALASAQANGIGLRAYFSPALHAMPAYAGYERAGGLEVTRRISERIISLPMANDLTELEIERIVTCVKDFG